MQDEDLPTSTSNQRPLEDANHRLAVENRRLLSMQRSLMACIGDLETDNARLSQRNFDSCCYIQHLQRANIDGNNKLVEAHAEIENLYGATFQILDNTRALNERNHRTCLELANARESLGHYEALAQFAVTGSGPVCAHSESHVCFVLYHEFWAC